MAAVLFAFDLGFSGAFACTFGGDFGCTLGDALGPDFYGYDFAGTTRCCFSGILGF